jgi:dephospho-CoA kinase
MTSRTARTGKRLIIGLTGVIGSGKSTVAELLAKHGAEIIDADLLAREVIAVGGPAYKSVKEAFPGVVTSAAAEIDRVRLSEIVFKNKEKRNLLENITHPLINKLYHERLTALQKSTATTPIVYNVPLLFESNTSYPEIDVFVVVSATEETCINRIMKRNNLSKEQATLRLKSQLPIEEKEKKAGYVIKNNGSRKELEEAVQQFVKKVF